MSGEADRAIRIDRLLVYLRFARTRSCAWDMIESHTIRRNRKHVRRASEMVCIGDVLTLFVRNEVRVVEIIGLPSRRASATLAKTFYTELPRNGPEQT